MAGLDKGDQASATDLRFGEFRLSGPNGPLRRAGVAIDLPRKPLALLWLLASRAGQVVTKDEILTAVWPRVVVTEGVVAGILRDLRRALGDDARQPRFIVTAHRIGYRFVGDVSIGAGASAGRPETPSDPAPGGAAFVGRRREREALQAAHRRALGGRRQLVFVTGEAGIGKSVLVDAFLSTLAGCESGGDAVDAVRIGHGQCIEHYGDGEPYLPILEAVTRLCRQPGTTLPEMLRRHAPTWLAQLPGLFGDAASAAPAHASAGSATRMLREMAEALDAAAAERPLVLVFEDLHWSDRSTVEWLAMLARRREPARLLVIATCRPVELIVHDHALKPIKQDLVARAAASEIVVGRLDASDVLDYVEQRRLPDAAARDLAATLFRRSQGHPLFMVHMADDLAGSPASAALDEAALPAGVAELIEAQLARLAPQQLAMLEGASVVGAEFAAAGVAAALQQGLEDVEAVLETMARQQQFIESRGLAEWPDGTLSGRYAFRHDLHRDCLYRRLGAARRVQLHARVGARLEASHGASAGDDGGGGAAELALHFEHAHEPRRAARHRRQASERALQRHAYREALVHAVRGLALLAARHDETAERDETAPRLELALRLTHGAALLAVRGFSAPEVEATYRRALALGIELDDAPSIGPALSGLYNLYLTRGAFERVGEIAEEVLAIVERSPEPVLSMLAHNVRGTARLFGGDAPGLLAHVDSVLALYDPSAHRQLAAAYGEDPAIAAHHCAALARWITGYPRLAAQHIAAGHVRAAQLQNPFGEAQMLWMEAAICLDDGDHPRVERLTQRLTRLCDEHEFPLWLAGGRILRGGALAGLGRVDEARVSIDLGLATWRAADTLLTLPHALAVAARVHGLGGDFAEALRHLDEALAIAGRTGERWYEPELHRLRGDLLLRRPDADDDDFRQAQACFEQAVFQARAQGALFFERRAQASLGALFLLAARTHGTHASLRRASDEFREARHRLEQARSEALLALA